MYRVAQQRPWAQPGQGENATYAVLHGKRASAGSHSSTDCCVAVYTVDFDSHLLQLVLVTQSAKEERGATFDPNENVA